MSLLNKSVNIILLKMVDSLYHSMRLRKFPQSHIYWCRFKRRGIGLSASLEDVKPNVFVTIVLICNRLCLHVRFVCNIFREMSVFGRLSMYAFVSL